jgi:hypothetical protein
MFYFYFTFIKIKRLHLLRRNELQTIKLPMLKEHVFQYYIFFILQFFVSFYWAPKS